MFIGGVVAGEAVSDAKNTAPALVTVSRSISPTSEAKDHVTGKVLFLATGKDRIAHAGPSHFYSHLSHNLQRNIFLCVEQWKFNFF